MGQKDVEREKPLFEGQSAEEFIKRWNAITKAIKMRAEMPEHEKVVSYDVITPRLRSPLPIPLIPFLRP